MTIQAREKIYYNGEEKFISSEPLKPFLQSNSDVNFIFKSTALVRGYIGSWKIKDNQLYLVALLGFIKNNKQVDINYLFPKQSEVFADWYSDSIIIPEGKLLSKINYELLYEKDIILDFEQGKLIGEKIVKNTSPKI